MSLLALCQSIHDTAFSTVVRESTWGFPVLAAVHVLGIAWFGGLLFVARGALRAWKRVGLAFLLATGALLFWVEPLKCYHSVGFWAKMGLLVALGFHTVFWRARRVAAIPLILWAAVVFAARAIAYF